jgi:hypothetical protein
LTPTVSSSPAAEMLYGISRKLIPNYCWFLFGALSLVFASLTRPIDLRVPLLTAIALVSLLVTLFGPVQWEFRYPFGPIFTAFTVHAFSLPANEPSQIPNGPSVRAHFHTVETALRRYPKVQTCTLKVPAFTLSV